MSAGSRFGGKSSGPASVSVCAPFGVGFGPGCGVGVEAGGRTVGDGIAVGASVAMGGTVGSGLAGMIAVGVTRPVAVVASGIELAAVVPTFRPAVGVLAVPPKEQAESRR